MPFKPMAVNLFEQYIKFIHWRLEKGSVDWNLCDHEGRFICSVIIAHGKKTKTEVTAFSVHKVKKAVEERGIKWPPNLKSKKK